METCVAKQAENPRASELCPEQIRTVILDAVASFQNCFEVELKKDRSLKGGVTIDASVEQGKVASATVSASSLGSPRVETCMIGVFLGLNFPIAGKPTKVSFPFLFKPR